MKLLKGTSDRSCYFEGSLAYVDKTGIKVFVRKSEKGIITKKVHKKNHPKAWSDLWKVYIPAGYTKTLSEFTDEELGKRKDKKKSEFQQFAEWVNARE